MNDKNVRKSRFQPVSRTTLKKIEKNLLMGAAASSL